MSEIDEEVFSRVLADKNTARMFVEQLERRGVKFNCDTNMLTHEQCIDAVLLVMNELAMRER